MAKKSTSESECESDTDPQVVEVARGPVVRKYFQRVSTARVKDALISQLNDKISTLELSVTKLETERRLLYRKLKFANAKDDFTSTVLPHQLPEERKRFNLSCEIISSVKKYYPRTGDDNRALVLLDMLRDGTIYGIDGAAAMKETHVAFGKDTFKAWKILKGLDRDDHAGNFGTVEILRKVESLEEFERGVFPGKSTISRRAKELERFAEDYVPYKCYRSSTGHRNIKFKYENVLRTVLSTLGLLEKAKTEPVEIAFTIDYAQVCSTTKRGHVLAGVKVVDRDTKIPGTDEIMFAFDDDEEDGDCKGGFHSRELDTCFPLHFCVGKESLDVFREDFKEFFEFGNRVSREGLVGRTEGEATLVPFNVTFPMDMSAEQKCFDLGGACKSARFFCIKCATELRKETYFWGKDSGHSCGSVSCVGGGTM